MNKKKHLFKYVNLSIKSKALCSVIDIFVCKCWLWECYLYNVSVHICAFL